MWHHEPSWVCLGCLFCTHDTQDCFGSWSLLPGHTVLRPPHLRTRPPTWEGMQMPWGKTVDATREDCRRHEGGLQMQAHFHGVLVFQLAVHLHRSLEDLCASFCISPGASEKLPGGGTSHWPPSSGSGDGCILYGWNYYCRHKPNRWSLTLLSCMGLSIQCWL